MAKRGWTIGLAVVLTLSTPLVSWAAEGGWTPTGGLGQARYNATATLLPTGKVLLAGGDGATGPLASAELYATTICRTCTLTVSTSGTGSGTVRAAGGGIACPGTCTAAYATSSHVTLTAAAAGSRFTGWGGACTGAPGDTCTLTLAAPKTVTATFTKVYTLTVTIGGSGGRTVSSSPAEISGCTGTCAASFESGTVVTLTASTGGGGTFIQWQGDACNGSTSRTCPVPMTAARPVMAVFSRTFTDATLTPRVTPIKAVHFTELGAAINTLWATAGLGPFAWTAGPPVPGGVVKAACLRDLRLALTQSYTKAGRAAPTFTDPTPTARTTPIKASHITELRTFVRNLE